MDRSREGRRRPYDDGRFEMKRPLCAVAVLAFVILPSNSAEASAGKACARIGSISGTKKNPLTCSLVKKKKIWVADTVANGKAPGALFQPIRVSYFSSLGMYISWVFPYDKGSSEVSAYRIEYMTDAPGFPWKFLIDAGPSQFLQYVKDDALIGYNFRFRVAAMNRQGIGPFSESDWILYGSGTAATTTTIQGQTGGSTTTTVRSATVATTTTTTTAYVPPTTTTTTSPYTTAQNQATKSATSYLKYTAFSRSGLIKQLEYEGFSNADATHGVDRQNADWNTQAARMAASYLRYSSFSRSGLINQLVYEGFTQSQAEYGVSTTGL